MAPRPHQHRQQARAAAAAAGWLLPALTLCVAGVLPATGLQCYQGQVKWTATAEGGDAPSSWSGLAVVDKGSTPASGSPSNCVHLRSWRVVGAAKVHEDTFAFATEDCDAVAAQVKAQAKILLDIGIDMHFTVASCCNGTNLCNDPPRMGRGSLIPALEPPPPSNSSWGAPDGASNATKAPAENTLPQLRWDPNGPSYADCGGSSSCPIELTSEIDGCSSPVPLPYIHILRPACNAHDICYLCGFVSRDDCDMQWYGEMYRMCDAADYVFNLGLIEVGWCKLTADMMYAAVNVAGHAYFIARGCSADYDPYTKIAWEPAGSNWPHPPMDSSSNIADSWLFGSRIHGLSFAFVGFCIYQFLGL